MINCPRCGKEISALKYKATAETYGKYTLEGEFDPFDYDMERFTFCCPECGETLCYDKETARSILKGGTQEWPKK